MGLNFPQAKLRDITRRIRQMRLAATDLTPVWPKVGNYLARRTREQFATRGARLGRPWKPLAKSTIEQKRRMGWPRSPLVRTGELKRSVTSRPMDIEQYRPKTARFGTNLDRAGWQHKGTRRNGRRHIPPRKIVGLTHQDVDEIVELIRKHVTKPLHGRK